MSGERRRPRVCLLTSTHISSNPRLVKEADALVEADYDVTVVGIQRLAALSAWDEDLSRPAGWSFHPVNLEPGRNPLRAQGARFRRALGDRAPQVLWPIGLAAAACCPGVGALAREAKRHPAELYIAHNLGALPAAARAADRFGAGLGFDAEDFHSGELPPTAENATPIKRVQWLERRYLPLCDHLTAASAGIARAYADLCGIEEPTTVLNVFPRSEAPAAPTRASWRPGPSLYWFSQTLGPDRGLEDAVRALGAMRVKAWLCLRGTPMGGYGEELLDLAAREGVRDRVRLLPPAPPPEMLRLSAAHDVGLALEQRVSPNRDICVTNKLFTYLGAGVPFAATATRGQIDICRHLGEVASLHEPGDWRHLARSLDELLSNRSTLARRRESAWRLARERYNWDCEKGKFLELVSSLIQAAEVQH